MKRTARKKLGPALKEFSDWVRTHRHLPTKELFRLLVQFLLDRAAEGEIKGDGDAG
ncbi:MAG: hypothetical protein ACREXU_18520 [Gammaproteobacteria bacterium]